ncbi:L-aspartate oxidase [Alicyclobacillus sp.]|uniref:L-aspartate oxidase n=1 Tax=Alicyclobacillus sp. TaxID=61169 RepID=UPI0025BBC5F5|nr:L-aspartate oxidase [Alicyclobacillus sp.]MCL6517002.1 L-aspartate oxidase [Alicyclobacillus sp.]
MRAEVYDFVVIGAGLAGSAAAWWLSHLGDVALLSKVPPEGSNSHHAQGGLAAAVGAGDAPRWHAEDTLAAGAGMARPDAVAGLTERAPALVRWLLELGTPFDHAPDGTLRLGLEGAHGRARILHAGGDASGRHILAAVRRALSLRPTVNTVHDAHALRLVSAASGPLRGRVVGAWVRRPDGMWFYGARRGVVLATGGAGALFQATTNPAGALGEGLALAHDAGASLRNLEFVQFHPTALDTPDRPQFLLSEALRGAGATLVDAEGARVMAGDPRGDLAPRDVVARAVYERLRRGERVYLDATGVPDVAERFPTVYAGCRARGYWIDRTPVPVTPAAHFVMGGIAANLAGVTEVPGLFAVGEVANTGCHGANRLASNSLLECLVMAYELYAHLGTRDAGPVVQGSDAALLAWAAESAPVDDEGHPEERTAALDQVRRILWDHVGLVRDGAGLVEGIAALRALAEMHPGSTVVKVARWMAESALVRQESRGAHFRRDFPAPVPALALMDTVCRRGQPPELVPAIDLDAPAGGRVTASLTAGA